MGVNAVAAVTESALKACAAIKYLIVGGAKLKKGREELRSSHVNLKSAA